MKTAGLLAIAVGAMALALTLGAHIAQPEKMPRDEADAVLILPYWLGARTPGAALVTNKDKLKKLKRAFAQGGQPPHACAYNWLIVFRTGPAQTESFEYNDACELEPFARRAQALRPHFRAVRRQPATFPLRVNVDVAAAPSDVAARLGSLGYQAFFIDSERARLPFFTLRACVSAKTRDARQAEQSRQDREAALEAQAQELLVRAFEELEKQAALQAKAEATFASLTADNETMLICYEQSGWTGLGAKLDRLDAALPQHVSFSSRDAPQSYEVILALPQPADAALKRRLQEEMPFLRGFTSSHKD